VEPITGGCNTANGIMGQTGCASLYRLVQAHYSLSRLKSFAATRYIKKSTRDAGNMQVTGRQDIGIYDLSFFLP